MARYSTSLLIIYVLLSLACQSYSSGLQQGVNRTDETAAISALRNIATAQRNYSVTHEGDYATFAQLVEGGYLDSRFGTDRPLKEYLLSLKVTQRSGGSPEGSYTCNADPAGDRPGRHFYIDSTDGVIHANDTQPASSSDPAIQ